MSNFDRFRLSHPGLDGDFEADGNITFNERHQYSHQVESGSDLLAGASDIGGADTSDLADVAESVGNAGSRLFAVTVRKSVNDGLAWGSYASYEDAVQLAEELGHQFSRTEIDTVSPATVEFGEYSEPGRYAPISVTVDEIEIPNDIGTAQSSVQVTFDLREVVTKSDITQPAPDELNPF
jgi:hypothetical protein